MQGHNGDEITAYLAKPLTPGPHPGVVLVHHRPGWDDLYREFTLRFARMGYLAICPNLYHREGQGTPEDVGALIRGQGGVADDQVVGDLQGATEQLRAVPKSNRKVGVWGTCSGGRHAFLFGCQTPGVGRGGRALGRRSGYTRRPAERDEPRRADRPDRRPPSATARHLRQRRSVSDSGAGQPAQRRR